MDRAEGILSDHDCIIVGAGSAGCVLAGALSRDARNRLLLLDAGGPDDRIRFRIPVSDLCAIGPPAPTGCSARWPRPG
jgi:choline dehydrogenase-like flavoprotein